MKQFFKLIESLHPFPWQKTFKSLPRLKSAIYFQISILLGKRTRELGLAVAYISKRIFKLFKQSGRMYTVQYLKQCNIALMHFAGDSRKGSMRNSSTARVSLTRCGLPRLISPYHRKVLRSNQSRKYDVLRMYLTIFSIYRVLECRGKPDLSAIRSLDLWGSVRKGVAPTVPNDNLDMTLLRIKDYTRTFTKNIRQKYQAALEPLITGFSDKLFWSSGPNTGAGETSLSSFFRDIMAYRIKDYDQLTYRGQELTLGRPPYQSIRISPFVDVTLFKGPELIESIASLSKICIYYPSFNVKKRIGYSPIRSIIEDSSIVEKTTVLPYHGRFGKKYEPAGKVRLFAMVDSIRQRVLYPLHVWVMNLLSNIPMDGTYNQHAPLRRLLLRCEGNSFHSLDLKSATDRFPLIIQEVMLCRLFDKPLADAWSCLLKSYPFRYSKGGKRRNSETMLIRFGIGQPLGALTSWPVFTLSHHMMVQFCASCCGLRDFEDYAILGDDLVIGNTQVAERYRRVMSILNVSISESKSLVSENRSLEFAKRFYWTGIDTSPVSFRAVESALVCASLMVPLVERLREIRSVSVRDTYVLYRYGFKCLSKITDTIPFTQGTLSVRQFRHALILASPKGPFPFPWRIWLSMGRKKLVTENEMSILSYELKELLLKGLESRFELTPPKMVDDEIGERFVIRPWYHLCLSEISKVLIGLVTQSSCLDLYVTDSMVPRTADRVSPRHGHKFGRVFKVYDRMTQILSRPPQKLLEVLPPLTMEERVHVLRLRVITLVFSLNFSRK